MTNILKFISLSADIGKTLLSWLQSEMGDAEPLERARERRSIAEAEFVTSGREVSVAYEYLFPGAEYPGDLLAKLQVISRLAFESRATDHPGDSS